MGTDYRLRAATFHNDCGQAWRAALLFLPLKISSAPACRKETLDLLDSVTALEELCRAPGNHLELLEGDRLGQYSNRINDQ